MSLVKRTFALIVLFLVTLVPGFVLAQEPTVEVSIDRNNIARGETLTLTIRVYQQRQNIQLDLSPLTENFDILSTRTSSQIRSINNQVESWVDYIVTLFPTREGDLEIPSLNVNGESTAPIPITVVDAGPNSSQGANELFLETEVNKESVFVQEQLLFTIRLYYTISGIRNPQFTELEMPETVIQLIGSPNQYEKLIDGVRYGVYEKRYVIFPQRSGPLEIPDILFRGEVTDGSSNFVFRNLNTQRVTAYIEGTTIEVMERPVATQNLDVWLPAASVQLEESWSGDLENLKVGDSISRTVTLTAEGLDGAVLPPFSPASVEGVNLYPDPPDVQRTFIEGRIVGTRVETTSIVPRRDGSIEIPAIDVPWWDINLNELRTATLPATRFTIATVTGQVPAEQSVAFTGNVFEEELVAPVLDQEMIDQQAQTQTLNMPVVLFNSLIAMAFAIVFLSVYLIIVRKMQLEPGQMLRTWLYRQKQKFDPRNNERVAFRQLGNAIDRTDLHALREALIVWAAHHYAPGRILSMDDIIRRNQDRELGRFCLQIQTALYTASRTIELDRAKLKTTIATMRKQQTRIRKEAQRLAPYQLPPLYKL
ncbi:MAG: BatD family protein [Pseudohongiellaceae bacterium]